MTTALKIIQRAFTKIGIRAAETPLTASESEDALEELNGLISEWQAVGVTKELAPTYELNTDLQEDRHIRSALINNLAPRLAAEYGEAITESLRGAAQESFNTMVASSWNLDTEFPDTLPVGSGNCEWWYWDTFFDQNSKDNF